MITSQGISLKRGNVRCGFSWKELEDLKGTALDVGGETVPWEDVQAELDEAGIDLASKEIQDKIAAQEQAILDAEPTEEQKQKAQKRREARERIKGSPPPNSMPNLAERVKDIEIALNLRDPEL